jgi:hypothetical protein
MTAMQLHKDTVELQKNGCGIPKSLAMENNTEVLIAIHGKIHCIITALQLHYSNKELQKKPGYGNAQVGGIESVLAAGCGFSDAFDELAKRAGRARKFCSSLFGE